MPDQPDRLFIELQAALAVRYSLERELGRGGMGVVYLAREVRLDRPVAIKLLPPHHTGDAHLRERFLREARTAAKLSHPHIIPIFAVDEVGAFVFFVMAYVAGETLTERVRRRGPLPPSEAGRVLREVAWALAYAHSQGLVHRDVKPDNIMLEEASGRALVADFGIAGLVRGAAGLDGGEVIGTPEFMSPEQALGEGVDARSDLYALGVVGYFAVSGTLPFEAGKATEVLAKQITEPAPKLASVAAGVPRRLAHAIDRCLEKDPLSRPQKGEELAEQLGLALEQRRELPVGLRVFVKRNARLGGMGGLIYVLSITYAALQRGWWVAQVFGWSVSAGMVGGFLALVRLQRRIDLDTRIWSWLWQGPIGRLLFSVARLLVPEKSLPPPATHRPTELALAMAAEQLFEQLPRETRHQLRELPDVVRRLEQDAQRMRQRLEELNDALGGKADEGRSPDGEATALATRHDRIVADLQGERDLVHTRLADAVRALETIRLNLLRLHAGSGSVQSLTTDLGLAREVASEINLLLEGRREIERELG